MSEFEDRINSVLNDPAQMEKITNLAKSLMGGEGGPGSGPMPAGGDMGGLASLAGGLLGGDGGLDPAVLGRLSRLISAGNEQDSDKRALLEAMKPYLSQKRRDKMDRAMRIARAAKIARLAMGEMGGEGDV